MREAPRFRSETVAVPEAPLETVEFCEAKAWGSWVTMSSMRDTPEAAMSSDVTWVTGLVVVRFAWRIRDPVTTISLTSVPTGGVASCAITGVAPIIMAPNKMLLVSNF